MIRRTIGYDVDYIDWSNADNTRKLVECVDWSFQWSKTDEGHDFWKDIAVKAARIAKLDEATIQDIEASYS